MASPTLNNVPTSSVGFPTDEFTASLIYGTKWGGSLGTGTILTYSFPAGLDTSYDPDSYPPDNPDQNEWIFGAGFTPLDAGQQLNFEDALTSWANVADIQFVELDDNTTEVGELRVAFSELVNAQGAGAWAYLPDDFPYAGDIFINHLYIEESFDEGSWYFNTIIHELGHALGLKHPFDEDGSEVVLTTQFDNIFYTVMTYTDDPSGNGYFVDRYPDTPMVIDILSIQYLYGENTTFNAEHSVYVYLDSGLYFETIWDAGGEDTLEHQGSADVLIDLRPGQYSTLGQPVVFTDGDGGPVAYVDPRTVWIAYGADIENAVGGAGNDQLVGNALDNELYGGDGMDVAAWWGAAAGVTVNLAVTGAQDTGGEGLDSLWDIEGLSGSGFNDLLIGDAGDNLLAGEAGDDDLQGGSGNDVLAGGAGNDVMSGAAGEDRSSYQHATGGVSVNLASAGMQDTGADGMDTLTGIENLSGSEFDDTLTGNSVDNVLSGLAGNDVLSGALGNDLLEGGAGMDTAAFADAISAVTVNLSLAGAQDTGGAGFDTLVDIENLAGSGFNDLLTGDDGNNILSGGAGNDLLDGGDGADAAAYEQALSAVSVNLAVAGLQDTLGAGEDSLANIEDLLGSGFNDTLQGNTGGNRLDGAAGQDLLDGHGGNDLLYGGDGDDSIYGSAAMDMLFGDAGADSLWGGSEADTLNGGAGIDALYGGSGDDVYTTAAGDGVFENADEGTDTVRTSLTTTLVANVENLVLLGGTNINGTGNGLENSLTGAGGKNTLNGLEGDDVLDGMAGNDILSGGAGNDQLQGGAGTDIIDYDADDGISVDGGSGSDTLRLTGSNQTLNLAGLAGTLYVGFETVELTGAGDNTVSFDAADLVALSSTTNTVTITGNAGDSVTAIGAWVSGGDIEGGSANFVKYTSGAATVLVQAEVLFGADVDESEVDDPGAPDDGPVDVDGNAEDDELDGSAFDDRLAGLDGDDLVNGGAGEDRLFGNSGDDALMGGAGDDLLKGGGGGDTLHGGSGNDTLKGGGGNDLLDGADGSDTYVLSNADESTDAYQDSGTGIDDVDEIDASKTAELHLGAVFSHAEHGIEIITGAGTGTRIVDADGPVAWDFTDVTLVDITALAGTPGADVISGSAGNDKVQGRGGDDQLHGGAGKDTILGQGGADHLGGGAGKDVLTGGKGADVFGFDTALDVARADRITDFTPGVDLLQLDDDVFTALTGLPGDSLTASEFQSGADNIAQDAEVRIIYNTATGALYYDADGNGDGAAVKIAVLEGAPALTEDDFIIAS